MRSMKAEPRIVVSADDRIQPSEPTRRPSRRRSKGDASGGGDMPPARPRKRLLPRLRLYLTPLQKLAVAGVGVVAVTVAGMVYWKSGALQTRTAETIAQALSLSAQAGFRVEDITVSGRGRTPATDILAALGVRQGAPILSLDIERIKDRLELLPSVRVAAVERRLPDQVHLAIIERTPVAIWQNNGAHTLVDKDGRLIPGSVAGFEELPVVVGDGAPAHASELLAMLAAEPTIAPRVKAAQRVGNRRWNLILDDMAKGLEVRLPEENPETALHLLADMEKERGLSTRQVTMVDLRAPDRLILKSERPQLPLDQPKRKDNGA